MVLTLCLNPSIDRYAEVDSFCYEDPMDLRDVQEEAGGKAINISRVLTRFQVRQHAILFAGGPEGRWLNGELDREGIAHSSVAIQDNIRSNQTIRVRSNNKIIKLNMPGPRIQPGECRKIQATVLQHAPGSRFLVFSGSLPPGFQVKDLIYLLKEWKKNTGAPILADTRPEVLREIIKQKCADIILPNLPEAEALAGYSLDTERDILRFLREVQRSVPRVIITAGDHGAYYLDDNSDLQQVFSPRVEVRSSVGAGDAFAAGLIMALVQDQPLTQALDLAVRCGAATCAKAGTGMCGPEDLD